MSRSPFFDNDFFAKTTPLRKNPFKSDSDVSQDNLPSNEEKSLNDDDMSILTKKIISDRNRDTKRFSPDKKKSLDDDYDMSILTQKIIKDRNWDKLTQNMKPFPPDKKNSFKNPFILNLHESGYYNSKHAIGRNGEFYDYKYTDSRHNFRDRGMYYVRYGIPDEGEFVRERNIGKFGDLYYKIIKTRLDDYDPDEGNHVDPYGIEINIKTNKFVKNTGKDRDYIINTLKQEGIFKSYKRNYTIDDFLYKDDDEYCYYSGWKRPLNDYLYESFSDHVFLKTFTVHDEINYIKVSKNIRERNYLVIDNIDGGILLREITHNEIKNLSYENFIEYFVNENNIKYIGLGAMMVIMKYMGNYVTGNSPKLWYKSGDDKIKELTKTPKKKPIVKLNNGEIVLIEQPPINEELTMITEEKLILFFQEYSDYLAEYGAIVTGCAAAFMVNRKIAPPEKIDIWLNEKSIYDFYDKFKKKKWKKIAHRYLLESEKFSPQAIGVMILKHEVYDLNLHIMTTNTDPRMIVGEVSLSASRAVWDPAVIESRDRYDDIIQHVVNFAGTEQSVIDDILSQKAVFLENPWDYEKTITSDLEQSFDLTKRTISQLVEYMSKGFSIKVSPDSGEKELMKKINNQNTIAYTPYEINKGGIVFNDYYVYNVNEEFKEVIETMIKIFEYEKHINTEKSPGFIFIKAVMLKITKEAGYDQFNCHNLTLLDGRKQKSVQLTSFRSPMFDITPSDDPVKWS